MRFFIKIFILIFIFNLLIIGQSSQRRSKIKRLKIINSQIETKRKSVVEILKQEFQVIDEIISATDKDKETAKTFGAKAIRIFPCCELENLTQSMEELSDTLTLFDVEDDLQDNKIGLRNWRRFSSHLLADEIANPTDNTIEFTAELGFEKGFFVIKKNRGNHGFFINLGKMPFENVSKETKEVKALATYSPPESEQRKEYQNIKNQYVSDNLKFSSQLSVITGNTYILRAISYQEWNANLDKIFAINVYRKDTDGSIILFIKTIQEFTPPKLREPEREKFFRIDYLGLKIVIEKNLKQNGFNDIQVEADSKIKTLTLKGTIPVGKKAEVTKITEDIYRGAYFSDLTLKTELTEK